MNAVTNLLEGLLQLLTQIGTLIVAGITAVEVWLRGQLSLAGVSPPMQTAILVAVAVILVLGALRLFGGLIRIAIVVVLLLIAIHILLPTLR